MRVVVGRMSDQTRPKPAITSFLKSRFRNTIANSFSSWFDRDYRHWSFILVYCFRPEAVLWPSYSCFECGGHGQGRWRTPSFYRRRNRSACASYHDSCFSKCYTLYCLQHHLQTFPLHCGLHRNRLPLLLGPLRAPNLQVRLPVRYPLHGLRHRRFHPRHGLSRSQESHCCARRLAQGDLGRRQPRLPFRPQRLSQDLLRLLG